MRLWPGRSSEDRVRLWSGEVRTSPQALAAVGGLFVVASLSLSRTFTTNAYLAWALPALVIGAAFALSYGHRSLSVSFGGLALAEFLTLPLLFAREETLALLPTSNAYAIVRDLLSQGYSGVLQEAAPVPPDPRFMIVIWTSFLALGFLAAAWVVVNRPVGAVITALAVTAFAGAVGEGDGQGGYAFTAVALTAGFFLLDGRHRIEAWGRGAARVPAYLGVPTLAVASLVALVGPPLLGAGEPLIDLTGALRSKLVIIKPLSDIQRQLRVDPPIEVMQVQAPSQTYWRLAGLDTYTGNEWVLEARPEPAANGLLPRQDDQPTTGMELAQTYRITSLLAPWLPAAYAATSVDVPASVELDPSSRTLLLQGDTRPGLTYNVTSRLPGQLVDTSGGLPVGDPDDSVPDAFVSFAQAIAADASTPFEQALALERHFRGYTYEEDVPGGHTVERLETFLRDRTGYCEQFAATMTLMLRGMGIPARVGVGFLPGTNVEGDAFIVTTQDAHAWVEANVPGMGWVNFDPTPTRGAPASGRAEGERDFATPVPVPAPAEASAAPEPTPEPIPQDGTAGTDDLAGVGTILRYLATALVLALLVGAVPGAKLVRRELRRSRTAPDEIAIGAFEELIDRARDLGYDVRPSDTPWEVYRRVFGHVREDARDAAADIVGRTVAAVYGRQTLSVAQAKGAWTCLGRAVAGLRQSVPWPRRIAAVFDPRTILGDASHRPRPAPTEAPAPRPDRIAEPV